MDREALLEIKKAYDTQRRTVMGVLLGEVEPPDAETAKLPLDQRYHRLSTRLQVVAKFWPDYDNPGLQVTRGVKLAEVEESVIPDVMLRFVRSVDSAGRTSSIRAEFYDARDGTTTMGLKTQPVGFAADIGQMIACERVSLYELPPHSPYRHQVPGEDTRPPEDRMTLLEQSLAQFELALADEEARRGPAEATPYAV